MTETQHQGVMAMVKIDGSKARQLREQKSLTQLYVATAVQVTTDTISRWENRRYPTIKRENALKLAEALEVALEEILETPPEPVPNGEEAESQQHSVNFQHEKERRTETVKQGVYVRWPILLLSSTIAALICLVGWVYFNMEDSPSVAVTAKRNLPAHCTPGQVFPVSIEVNVQSDEPLAFIVKEQLPDGFEAIQAAPALSSSGKKVNTLKWLQKGHGKHIFTYTAIMKDTTIEADEFSGGIAINKQSGASYSILGSDTIIVSDYHWADSNRDRVISDSEILTVYDQYGEVEVHGIDLDLIEEIWLGSGYTWNPDTQTYQILP
ncbi:helix-turn-helix transcriptional regulator [Desulfosediminicola ganghwensis]|uniref:helix-turn-helix transcriptional regulator n=1 Tax=Desulfosediminicola ganghwensis TaxID=2569540 RepID=UPI0010AD7447|nr:helix-turn-helix transcriptional regulator [Desulfosediminicola ganghwensis]